MKLTMPEVLGWLGSVVVGSSVVLGPHAKPPNRAIDAKETVRQISKIQRVMSFLHRDERGLEITLNPRTPEGVSTYVCRGGVEIVCKSPTGTIRIAAEEAEIRSGPQQKIAERGLNGGTLVNHEELPLKVHAKGNVVLRHDDGNIGGKGNRTTIRALQVDYDFVTDRIDVFGDGDFVMSPS